MKETSWIKKITMTGSDTSSNNNGYLFIEYFLCPRHCANNFLLSVHPLSNLIR